MISATWLGQGGYLFAINGKKLCVDPYLSDSVSKSDGFSRLIPIPIEPRDLQADLLLCTHHHQDHLDPETVLALDREKIGGFYGPDSCVERFSRIGIENSIPFNRGSSCHLGGAELVAVYADHTSDSIGLIIAGEVTVYLTGESRWSPKLLEAKQFHPDILICCMNGKLGNMDFREAARLAEELQVKIAIPSHYGMFAENTEDPERLRAALSGTGIQYRELPWNQSVLFK